MKTPWQQQHEQEEAQMDDPNKTLHITVTLKDGTVLRDEQLVGIRCTFPAELDLQTAAGQWIPQDKVASVAIETITPATPTL